MAAADALPELFPFIFFGCWNQPGIGDLPRDRVFEAVSSMHDIKAIVLGGDNVYPRPIPAGGKKTHEIAVFKEGIDKYMSLGKPIIPAFGNHNVEDKHVLEEQKTVFHLTTTYFQRDFAGGVHIVVLDSNIINKGPSDPEYKEMLDWFRSAIGSMPADHKYYLVQHDPYFTARVKKGVPVINELLHSDIFLELMFARPPIAILCADTHNYQYSTIQSVETVGDPMRTLHQFIVGTGGANYDQHSPTFKTQRMRDRYMYTKINIVEGFGFLRISGPDPAAFDFIHVAKWSGGRRQLRSERKRHRRLSKQRRTRRNSR
jgi:hypothetical protein